MPAAFTQSRLKVVVVVKFGVVAEPVVGTEPYCPRTPERWQLTAPVEVQVRLVEPPPGGREVGEAVMESVMLLGTQLVVPQVLPEAQEPVTVCEASVVPPSLR